MKKHIFLGSLFFAIGIMLIFSACSDPKGKELAENNVTFDTLYLVKTHHLEGDSTKPSCAMKLSYVYPLIDSVPQAGLIQQELNYQFFGGTSYEGKTPEVAIEKYLLAYIDNYENEAATNFGDWKTSKRGIEYYSYYQIIESSITYNKGGLLGIQIKSNDFKGELMSFVTYRNLVFDLKTGRLVKEQDIFNEDYKSQLSTLLKTRLLQMYKLDNVDKLMQEGFNDIKDITPNDNFMVDEKGLTYIFNVSSIAKPVLGDIRIFIPYSLLKDILKVKSPITVLFN